MGIVFDTPLVHLAVGGAISFGLALLYFSLLDRFEGRVWFWVVLIGGLWIGFV